MSFSCVDLLSSTPPAQIQTVIFAILCLGFAIKAPLFSFHTWMPRVLEPGPVVTALSERLQTSRIAMEVPAPEAAQLAQAD